MEDLRLTPYSHYLRFIHNNHNLRFKWRRGRGGQKGVGARRFQDGLDLTNILLAVFRLDIKIPSSGDV